MYMEPIRATTNGVLKGGERRPFRYQEMLDMPGDRPPWGSKGAVNRAGEKLRRGEELSEVDYEALEAWRAGHSYILNTFQPLLRYWIEDEKTELAQRLKRRHTIVDKLTREPGMELARMDDIAGTRLIFPDIAALETYRARLRKARFKHKLRHDRERYNYIEQPKESGYRGVHEIYVYDARSRQGKRFNGLYIEVQLRTQCQHAWATAVEVVAHVTEHQPKFGRGDERVREFFRLASEIISRSVENKTSCKAEFDDFDLADSFLTLNSDIKLLEILGSLPIIEEHVDTVGNVILQLKKGEVLKAHTYETVAAATEAYFELEKNHPEDDLVLVRANTIEGLRSAYRNYFQDTRAFVSYVIDGTHILLDRIRSEH
jgi:ppGpp synthetase/RelA/SpoT-type nucleotidyltranferase